MIEALSLHKEFPARKNGPSPGNGKNGDPRNDGGQRLFSPKARPQLVAVEDVSLTIQSGEIFGLLGPNGAGKSTTIRMLATLLEPSRGTARIAGFDVVRQPQAVRRRLGTVLGGERSTYWKLTGRENLEYFAALYQIPGGEARLRIQELLARLDLEAKANELVERYSSGMKQRLALARALLPRPPVLLLDEPTVGLDPQSARNLRQIIRELKEQGHTILLTTHYMEEADQLSDRIAIIDHGRVIALDTPRALKASLTQQEVCRLEAAGLPDPKPWASQIPGVQEVNCRFLTESQTWEVTLHLKDYRAAAPELLRLVTEQGGRVIQLSVKEPTLEDVFLSLTGKALRD
ncbi:MAG: ATP-binding cassette domain-containing protein [Firmicutes bacterium]|nr:ATP-binding cassette domain-containing protein [Bacillota bacterium]